MTGLYILLIGALIFVLVIGTIVVIQDHKEKTSQGSSLKSN